MDFEDVYIVDTAAEKIAKSIKSSCNGLLVGWEYNDTILVTGCVCHEVIGDIKQLDAWLPEGIYICGTFSDDENHENVTSEESYIHIWLGDNDSLCCLLDNAKLINVEKIPYNEAKIIMRKSSVLFQTDGNVIVNVVKNGTVHFDEEHVISENTAFLLLSNNTVLSSESSSDQTCNDLLTQSKINLRENNDTCLQTTILKCASSAHIGKVPLVKMIPLSRVIYRVPVHFNALCFVPKTTPLSKVASYLRVSLLRQLHLMRTTITDLHDTTVQKLAVPEFEHFYVPGWCHPVSVCFPANQSDDELTDYRKNVLHPTFLELCTKPIFRRANAIHFNSDKKSALLTNPHIGLKDPKLLDGKVHLLDGFYQYHHYMQDNFNDNGWGCAYRSLQSLVSWFRHQGYTDKPVPSHEEIQKILVAVGDKPKEFVGTKKWIGSIEVNNVLNEYLGVTSKIMFVSQGSELASRGRELAMHFDNQGTPVMIGGGVLAHTILGVCFSETTGDTSFLILDPHYTGSEDLKTIQEKGWCGWKSEDFWNQTAYYNLCLPQRPVAC